MSARPSSGRETVLDAAALARLAQLDPEGKSGIFLRVMRTYEESLASAMAGLRRAQESDDTAAVRRLTHTLKSSSASVGAVLLAACCAEAEALVRDGRLSGLPAVLAGTLEEGERTLAAVRRLLDR